MTGRLGGLRREAAQVAAMFLLATSMFVCGRSSLPPPPLLRPHDWFGWWQSTGPLDAVFSLARVGLVIVAGAWALALLSALVATRAPHGRNWLRAFEGRRLTVVGPPVRLALALAGMAVSGSALSACGAGAGAPGPSGVHPPGAPVLVHVRAPRVAGEPGAVQRRGSAPSVSRPPEARGRSLSAATRVPATRVPATRVPATDHPSTSTSIPSPAHPAPDGASGVDGGTRRWVVRHGDSLWSIAESTLGATSAGRPDPATVAAYWLSVVRLNEQRLPVPGDPSLLFPGDVIVLPQVPS